MKMYVFSYQLMIKYSSSVNYYYKRVIILTKKHPTVDIRWDCDDAYFMHLNEYTSSQKRVRSTNVGLCLGHNDI